MSLTNKTEVNTLSNKIAVFSGKGGVGKSTISAILAVAAGDSVLIDCDPQASLSHWGDLRESSPEVISLPPTRIKSKLPKITNEYVIVDTPGALVSGTLDALKLMDLIVVVTPVDTFELAALNDTLNTAEVARKPIVIVVNRLHPQARSENALGILSELDIPVCPTIIRERAIHRHLLVEGSTCFDKASDGVAARELGEVWSWIHNQLIMSKS
jgi:chromosome partitioning protein